MEEEGRLDGGEVAVEVVECNRVSASSLVIVVRERGLS